MKTIKEYINNDNWQPTLRLENSNEYFYEQLEDFYGKENIPNKYIELFEDRTLYKLGYDYINENLKTHDYKKLQNKLLEYYSEDASSYFDKCHRQAYHFTYKTNVDKILKNGIKIRERNSVIKYPKRIYIWASDKKINKSEINDFIKTLFGYEFDENKIGIIKIDLYNTNYPVYKDTAMKEKEALFICNSIPANLCKEIKI